MFYHNIDFDKISRALSSSIEAISEEEIHDDTCLRRLKAAKEELQQALSFSLTTSLQK